MIGGATAGTTADPTKGPARLPLLWALLPLVVLVVCFGVSAATIGLSTAALIVSMLVAAVAAGLLALGRGNGFDDVQHATGQKLAAVLPVLLILLAIGGLIGSWVLSGTIPMLVALGVRWIDPQFFVLTAFLATALMSLCTGTSWGSAGTLGVALMATAAALGVPLPPTAGAVVGGAYFGDKMSPLSDSTNICSLGAAAGLYAHIRHMLYTALPSMVVSIAVYAWLGRSAAPTESSDVAGRLLADIDAAFAIGPLVLLPVLVVIVGVVLRRPPVLVLAASSVVALTLGVSVQGFAPVDAVNAFVAGFSPEMIASDAPPGGPYGGRGLHGEVPGELFRRLVERGGLYSMSNVLVVILSAFLLAGGMEVSGALDRILEALLSSVRSTAGLIVATMTAGAAMISLTSHGGVTALIVGGMFQSAFRERRLAPENLSRSLEDSVTVVEPLLPWTVSAIFMATTLGVPTIDYLPWAIFCFGGPIFSLAYALSSPWTGLGIRRLGEPVVPRESARPTALNGSEEL